MEKSKIRIATIITRLTGGGAQHLALKVHSNIKDDKFDKYFICGEKKLSDERDYYLLAHVMKIKLLIIDELVRDVSPLNDIIALINTLL